MDLRQVEQGFSLFFAKFLAYVMIFQSVGFDIFWIPDPSLTHLYSMFSANEKNPLTIEMNDDIAITNVIFIIW